MSEGPTRRTAFAMPTPRAAHELGLGELTIKALLGHARLGVTSGYVATLDSFLLAAADKVARHIDRAMMDEMGTVVRLPKPRASVRKAHA